MKKFLLFVFIAALTINLHGQGSEDFTNSNASGSYNDGSFVGNDNITWSYVESRDGNDDENESGITLPALMLRRASDGSKISSSTISGGIGNFSVKLYKGFTGGGDRQVELFINGQTKGTSVAFDDFDEHVFTVENINISGDFTIEIVNTTEKQIIIDDITWTAGPTGPEETVDWANLQWPVTIAIEKGASETIYAQVYESGVTDAEGQGAGIEVWVGYNTENTDPSTWVNWIEATYSEDKDNNDEYTVDFGSNLEEGTYYYATRFRLNNSIFTYGGYNEAGGGTWDGTTNVSGTCVVTVAPKTATLPYSEDFATDFGSMYTYNAQGETKAWEVSGGVAGINGFNSGDVEEDWLVFPVINLDNYENEILTFKSWWKYGNEDADNYLKLLYATDYTGTGDPSSANWQELTYSVADAADTWEASGDIDLSGITGDKVVIAFKHQYSADNYRSWELDDINIAGDEISTSVEDVNSNAKIYSYNNQIFVNLDDFSNTEISVYNLIGERVYHKISTSKKNIISLNAAVGTYIVKVKNNKEVTTKKVFVK